MCNKKKMVGSRTLLPTNFSSQTQKKFINCCFFLNDEHKQWSKRRKIEGNNKAFKEGKSVQQECFNGHKRLNYKRNIKTEDFRVSKKALIIKNNKIF